MGVRFVVGRAGSGRSRHCFDAIVSAMRSDPLGAPIYWILPKQATFSAERELATLSGLDAFCRARVLSFELLGEEVLSGCGGAAVPQISAIGRQMLLGHLLRSRADDLSFFNGVARQPGLAARLDTAFAELERCGHDPAQLDEVIEQLGKHDGGPDEWPIDEDGLRRKLSDFGLLYRAYRRALGEGRVDPHRRLEQVLGCIDEYPPLSGAAVYIDDFRQFSARERRMIVALARCAASVEITLLIDPDSPTLADLHHLPDELNLFHLTEGEYRRLALDLQEAGIVLEPRVALRSNRRMKSPALQRVERMFDSAIERQPRTEALEFIEATDRRNEVDAIARRIRQSVAQGLRLRQIAVLMRDIDDYEPLLAASFAEHGIAYFVDRRKSAIHHPLLQFVHSALRIARSRWRDREAVLALLKSGLSGPGQAQVDELENYVLLHRIDGPAFADPDPWSYTAAPQRDTDDADETETARRNDPSPMDALRRRISKPLIPFIGALTAQPAPTVRQRAIAIFKLLGDFGVRETIAGWIEQAESDNEPELRGEHEQVWAGLCELFDQMVDLLGEVTMELDDFLEVLDVGLERFDLALPPPTVDQVLVGTVDRTRTPALHSVFVLGLSEGQFPRLVREDPMLNDSERQTLRGRKLLELDPASTPRQLDERLLGYIGFTSASDRLIVSRALSHDDRAVNPSSFWIALRRLFPDNPVAQACPISDAGPQAIGTPRQLITSLMRWARQPEEDLPHRATLAALYDFLAHHPAGSDAIAQMRAKAWPALAYRNAPSLPGELADQIYRGGLWASVTRIESFAACPFRHFARYTLRLEPRDQADVTRMDLGTVYHGILERVVKRVLKENVNWCDISPAASREMIAQFAREVGQSLREQIMLSSARSQYLLEHIERTLDYVCAAQQAVLKRGQFRPVCAELHFGREDRTDSLPPLVLKTPKGRELRLQGKIDRVDFAADARQVAVIDYKMRGHTLSLCHVYYGLSLQLLVYLLVLDACGETFFKSRVAPVAAFYAQLLRQFESIEHPHEAVDTADEQFDLRIKQRGIFDFAAIGAIDQGLETGKSDVVQCQIKKDGHLGNPGRSDAADSAAFKALLKYVEARIKELADQMIDGEISPRPYRMGKISPCAGCDYRSVCRFDPLINSYLHCPPMPRDKVLEQVIHGGSP